MKGMSTNDIRSAGRDYYEISLSGNITVRQAMDMGFRVCPCCEWRLIEGERVICRHCQAEIDKKKAEEQSLIVGGLTLLILALCAWAGVELGLSGASLLVCAALVTFAVMLVLVTWLWESLKL